MQRFLDFMAADCPSDAVVKSTSVVELGDSCVSLDHHQQRPGPSNKHAWEQQQPQGRRGVPLLSTELTVSADGTQLAYSTAPDAMRDHLLAVFDRGIQRLQVGEARL